MTRARQQRLTHKARRAKARAEHRAAAEESRRRNTTGGFRYQPWPEQRNLTGAAPRRYAWGGRAQ
jgi:hypothetical protein